MEYRVRIGLDVYVDADSVEHAEKIALNAVCLSIRVKKSEVKKLVAVLTGEYHDETDSSVRN